MVRPFRIRPTLMLLAVLLACFLLGLTGCEPSDMRNIKNTLPDSATLAASVAEAQPTKSARSATTVAAKPTKNPTRTATKSAAPSAIAGKRVKNTPGNFDFYVLSLSWSPDYCAGSNVDDPQQCGLGKKLGFILHGLWPQFNRGYPADCSTVPLPIDAQQQFPNLLTEHVPQLSLDAESGFYWLPFNKAELQIYNIRHLQQHAGELMERLGSRAGLEVDWVGLKYE